jgi:hypothetical protein
MRWIERTAIPVLALAALGLSGCAGAYMAGMETAKSPPLSAVGIYKAETCTDLTTGQPIAIPPVTYFLEQSGPQVYLYEFDASQRGARVINHWVEGQEDMFFGYVKLMNRGFKWVVPFDRTLPGKRLVYVIGQFRAIQENGVMKVDGNPIVECTMFPDPSNQNAAPVAGGAPVPVPAAALAPAPSSAQAPAVSNQPACESDNDCPGDDLCESARCVPPKSGAPAAAVQPQPGSCRADKECPGEELCVEHRCVPPEGAAPVPQAVATGTTGEEALCKSNKGCKGGRICQEGRCLYPEPESAKIGAKCKLDVDCPGKLICEEKKCAKPRPEGGSKGKNE